MARVLLGSGIYMCMMPGACPMLAQTGPFEQMLSINKGGRWDNLPTDEQAAAGLSDEVARNYQWQIRMMSSASPMLLSRPSRC